MQLIERKTYFSKMLSGLGTPDIKVITGIRRCGKSKLMKQFRDYLSRDSENNVVFINLNLEENEPLLLRKTFSKFIRSRRIEGKKNFLLIDEVQEVEGFERTINSLHEEGLFDIYLTGSNAFLLSSDLATLFTGRVYEIPVLPFSYSEYLDYHSMMRQEATFDDYVADGGFAGSYVYRNPVDRREYVRNEVYGTILQRDLVKKYSIRSKPTLKSLSDFLMNNISNLSSTNGITEYLNRSQEVISNKTVANYIGYLCNAFLFYKAERYDLKGKRYLATDHKYYLSDVGLRYAALGTRNLDYGRAYENIVFLELKRRGYEVYIGKLYQKEIDFVAMKGDAKTYLQVTATLEDEKTKQREIAPLLAIKNAYPKIIIARTKQPVYDIDGVQVIDIEEWLKEKED